MIIRVVEIVVIQRQLSRAIQVVRAAVITRQLLHPRLHQHQLLHRHQPLSLLLHLHRQNRLKFGLGTQIIIMQLVSVVMMVRQVSMQIFVIFGVQIEFLLAIQRLVLD